MIIEIEAKTKPRESMPISRSLPVRFGINSWWISSEKEKMSEYKKALAGLFSPTARNIKNMRTVYSKTWASFLERKSSVTVPFIGKSDLEDIRKMRSIQKTTGKYLRINFFIVGILVVPVSKIQDTSGK